MVDQLKLRWPRDWTKLHLYFVPHWDEIRPIVDAYRNILHELDCVASQPDEWLHATLMVVEGLPTHDVENDQIVQLSDSLESALRDVPTFTVTCGPALVGRSSVALDLVPDSGFVEIVRRTNEVTAEIFGGDALQYSISRPHVSLAYATGSGDSGAIQAELRNVTDVRTQLTVDNVRLVDVRVDMDLMQFCWEELSIHRLADGSRAVR